MAMKNTKNNEKYKKRKVLFQDFDTFLFSNFHSFPLKHKKVELKKSGAFLFLNFRFELF